VWTTLNFITSSFPVFLAFDAFPPWHDQAVASCHPKFCHVAFSFLISEKFLFLTINMNQKLTPCQLSHVQMTREVQIYLLK
jgi:hypothetical protein